LFRAVWEAASVILKFARVTHFRGDEDLAFTSGVGGSMDLPGTTAGGIDNMLLSLPTEMPKIDLFLFTKCLLLFMSKIGNLAHF